MHATVVIAYYNRLPQLAFTLRTISMSDYPDLDVIVVDDMGEPALDAIAATYPYPIQVIRPASPKMWHNPCVAFNTGFRHAQGDVIITNQCECCHRGDAITRLMQLVDDGTYVSCQVYAASREQTTQIQHVPQGVNIHEWIDRCLPKVEGEPDWQHDRNGWWNHAVYRPMKYHWVAAITRANLEKLKGFDERFAYGWWFEDNDFVDRAGRLGLKCVITSDPDIYAVHQYHPEYSMDTGKVEINRAVYGITSAETGHAAKANTVYNPCPV